MGWNDGRESPVKVIDFFSSSTPIQEGLEPLSIPIKNKKGEIITT